MVQEQQLALGEPAGGIGLAGFGGRLPARASCCLKVLAMMAHDGRGPPPCASAFQREQMVTVLVTVLLHTVGGSYTPLGACFCRAARACARAHGAYDHRT